MGKETARAEGMVWSRKTPSAFSKRNGLVWLASDGYQKVDVDRDLEATLAVKYKVNAQRKACDNSWAQKVLWHAANGNQLPIQLCEVVMQWRFM